jgi:Ca2+ regulator and membrane fusion protein Fig1
MMRLEYTQATSSNTSPLWSNITDIITSNTAPEHLEIRIGYFGICVNEQSKWACRSSVSSLSGPNQPNDPVGAIDAASRFKDEVLFPGLL